MSQIGKSLTPLNILSWSKFTLVGRADAGHLLEIGAYARVFAGPNVWGTMVNSSPVREANDDAEPSARGMDDTEFVEAEYHA